MAILGIHNIAFTLAGGGVSWLELASVVFGLGCVILAGRNSKANFWVGYFYNILLFMLFYHQHLYSAMLIQPVAFFINAYGHYRWSHPHKGEESDGDAKKLKVRRLDAKGWGMAAVIVLLATMVWGFVLTKLGTSWGVGTFEPDPSPWLDAFSLMITFLAQILSAMKMLDCWYVWLVVNVINISLYLSAGLVFMPLVSVLYLANGIWSLLTWNKLYKKGK